MLKLHHSLNLLCSINMGCLIASLIKANSECTDGQFEPCIWTIVIQSSIGILLSVMFCIPNTFGQISVDIPHECEDILKNTEIILPKDYTDPCPICLDYYDEGKVVKLPCEHIFHEACIVQ
mmetsp:Transcript_30953/g.5579  ORF Transcript_30953/g.5579 Transcript_30953/m.5579 type:complete len:121 (-) Transcript_30953:102-464(-)